MTKRRAAIFISGRGTNMTALMDAMADPAYPAEAALVLTNNPDAPGLALAETAGVATKTIDHRPFGGDRAAFEAKIEAALAEAGIDLICLAGFMRILTGGFTARWRDRIVNIHPSLLPSFRGLETHARALAAGAAFHGCTVHLARAEMDDGPILGQALLTIGRGETAQSLAKRVLTLEHRLYPAALDAWLSGALALEGDVIRPGPLALTEEG